jgi:hypothetical protein
MPPAINLVCTRCIQGDHLSLRRWYADHVQLLLAAPTLQKALLYRCTQVLHGSAPDYFCIYDFAQMDDFFAFEHSPEKAQASVLTNAAAGRSSIEIVQRTQYVRWLHRQWAALTSAPNPTWRLAVCLQSDASWSLDAQRALADQLQALHSSTPLVSAQAYTQHEQASQAFLALDFEGGDVLAIWEMLLLQFAQPSLYGSAPSLQIHWAASASLVQVWLR